MSLLNKNSSASDSSQKTSTATSSENTNVQGGSGSGINIGKLDLTGGSSPTLLGKGGGGGVNIVNTDAGAIKGSQDLAATTVDAARSITGDSAALAKSIAAGVLDFASSTGRTLASNAQASEQNAFDFGSVAFGSVDKALQTVSDTSSSTLDKALQFAGDTNQRFQTSLASTTAALNEIGKQQNTSTDQRIQDTATTAIKAVAIVVGVIALAAAIYAGSK